VGPRAECCGHYWVLESIRKNINKKEYEFSSQYHKPKIYFYAEFSKIIKRIRDFSWWIIIFAKKHLMRFGM
jgi:hypothetical protein